MSTYYTSKYSGEQIDEAVKKILEGGMTGDYADRQLSNLDTSQGALANLGAGVRPNLLINPFFEVNQRGQSAYTANGYTVDMWARPTGDLTVTPIENGVRLTWTAGIYFRQGFENPSKYNGKSVTISGMFSNPQSVTGCSLRLRVNGSFSGFSVPVTGAGCFFATFQMPNEVTELWFEIGASSGSIDWNYAKLEEGSTQTLAYQDDTGAWQLLPQPESDYATQLAKCQRYLLPIGMGSVLENIRVSRITSSGMYFFVPTPAQMRVAPTLSGDAQIITMSNSAQTGFAFSTQLLCNGINVVAAKDGHGLSDARLNLQNCFLSAEF